MNLKNFNFSGKTIDEIKKEVKSKCNGYKLHSYMIQDIKMVIRIRVIGPEKPKKLDHITYPPPEVVKNDQRANRKGSSLFYCANNLATALEEVSPSINDEIVISYWYINSPFLCTPIGFTEEVLKKLGSTLDTCPIKFDDAYASFVKNDWRTSEMYELFTGGPGDYKNSIAISEFYFTPILINSKKDNSKLSNCFYDEEARLNKVMDSLMYPSVKNKGRGLNFAFQPSFVDQAMTLVRADHCKVTQIDPIQLNFLSFSNYSTDRNLIWEDCMGKFCNWTVNTPEGPVVFFIHEGKYSSYNFKHGIPLTDTNQIRSI